MLNLKFCRKSVANSFYLLSFMRRLFFVKKIKTWPLLCCQLSEPPLGCYLELIKSYSFHWLLSQGVLLDKLVVCFFFYLPPFPIHLFSYLSIPFSSSSINLCNCKNTVRPTSRHYRAWKNWALVTKSCQIIQKKKFVCNL